MCSQKKDIIVKVFNILTNENGAKIMAKHISCNCKCKFNSTKWNSNQKWNNETFQCECKSYRKCKRDYSLNPSKCICDKRNYLKSAADTSLRD